MADKPPSDDRPPPYAPGTNPPETEPPPYTPTKETAHVQGAAAHAQTYGAASVPPKDPDNYPPGAPVYIAHDEIPMTNSTALLITRERKPPSFLLLSIMTCLCFSPLFGLLAIIFSCLSDSAWAVGDVQTARRYSQVAASLSIVGIVITVFTVILIFVTGAVRVH